MCFSPSIPSPPPPPKATDLEADQQKILDKTDAAIREQALQVEDRQGRASLISRNPSLFIPPH